MKKILLILTGIGFYFSLFSQANLTYVKSHDSTFCILNAAAPPDTIWVFNDEYLIRYDEDAKDTVFIKGDNIKASRGVIDTVFADRIILTESVFQGGNSFTLIDTSRIYARDISTTGGAFNLNLGENTLSNLSIDLYDGTHVNSMRIRPYLNESYVYSGVRNVGVYTSINNTDHTMHLTNRESLGNEFTLKSDKFIDGWDLTVRKNYVPNTFKIDSSSMYFSYNSETYLKILKDSIIALNSTIKTQKSVSDSAYSYQSFVSKKPYAIGGFSDSLITVNCPVAGQWYQATNAWNNALIGEYTFELQLSGDTLEMPPSAKFRGGLSVTFSGSTGNEYEFRVRNVTQDSQISLPTGETGNGAGSYRSCSTVLFSNNNAGDKYIIEVRNVSSTNSVTLRHMSFEAEYLSEL